MLLDTTVARINIVLFCNAPYYDLDQVLMQCGNLLKLNKYRLPCRIEKKSHELIRVLMIGIMGDDGVLHRRFLQDYGLLNYIITK